MKHCSSCVVIGASAGGIDALLNLVRRIPTGFPAPIIIVLHMSKQSYLSDILEKVSKTNIIVPSSGEPIENGNIYICSPDYHLNIEKNKTISYSGDEKVLFSRPSIDVLFETAAEAYRDTLIGIILSGANHDGSKGLYRIKQLGGKTIVQTPSSAKVDKMPMEAIIKQKPDYIMRIEYIPELLEQLLEYSDTSIDD